jgi:multidrug efflux pump subunit AcrB
MDGGSERMPVLVAVSPFTSPPPLPCVRSDAQGWFVVEVRSKRGSDAASAFALGYTMPALRGFRMAGRVRLVAGWQRAILIAVDEDRARARGVDVAAVTALVLSNEPSLPGRPLEGGPPGVRVLGRGQDVVETLRERHVGKDGARLSEVATVTDGLRRVERLGARTEDRVLLVVEGNRLDPAFEPGVRATLRELSTLASGRDVELAIGRSADEVEVVR